MKRLAWLVVLLMAAAPVWAAKKISVQQLQDLLASLQAANKSDADVAIQLKQVELTEQLTRATMNSLVSFVPGPNSTAQIYVLEAKSALLAPPATDLPTTPAPDDATQKALLDKASAYAANTYAKLPNLTATRTTLRFQDNTTAVAASSGIHSGAEDSSLTDPNLMSANQSVNYINSAQVVVAFQNGAEQNPLLKDKTRWGANGYIALLGQQPVLSAVFQEAQAAGKFTFLRWEMVNGKAAAVFTFSVDKKKSHYAVNYCCFPDVDQAGSAKFTSAAQASLTGGQGGVKGNFQTSTDYKPFKSTVAYRGEIFVDPDTGVVVRLVTQGEFKTSDVVHQEDQRIDYTPVTVGDKALVLPTEAIVNTEVVPNGDSGAGKFVLRHTLFVAEYKDYK